MNSRKRWLRFYCGLLVMLLLVVTVARPSVTRASPRGAASPQETK